MGQSGSLVGPIPVPAARSITTCKPQVSYIAPSICPCTEFVEEATLETRYLHRPLQGGITFVRSAKEDYHTGRAHEEEIGDLPLIGLGFSLTDANQIIVLSGRPAGESV